MLSFEGEKFMGSQNIIVNLSGLPFQHCKHNITTVDCQPSGPSDGVLVLCPTTSISLASSTHSSSVRCSTWEAVQLLKHGTDLITDADKALSTLLSYPLYSTLARYICLKKYMFRSIANSSSSLFQCSW